MGTQPGVGHTRKEEKSKEQSLRPKMLGGEEGLPLP